MTKPTLNPASNAHTTSRFNMERADAEKKYRMQRANAAHRGIAWEFTFETWAEVWERSGKWSERGRKTGAAYVMARNGDKGPYSPGNVYITTVIQNAKDCRVNSPKSQATFGRGKGWSYDPAKNASNPYTVRFAGKHIGCFATEAEARQAYLVVVAEFFSSQKERS